MPFSIRSWTDCDTGRDREISQAIYPEYSEDPLHPAWFPAQQLGAPREYSSRYVAESGKKEILGYATLWELRPARFRFDLAVRPEWQRQGIATQLLARIVDDARRCGATGLQARVRDDKTDALAFVSGRDFHESQRMDAYRLEFGQADVSRFQHAFTRLHGLGIDVGNLDAIREQDPDYIRKFYELFSAARDGWPDPDPDPAGPSMVPMTNVKRWLDETVPTAFFVASHRGRYIAFTSMFSIGTAVHPEYRRKGIATLLKAGSIADAHCRGFRGQTSSTASPGMKRVFEGLGYRRTWSEIRLIRSRC